MKITNKLLTIILIATMVLAIAVGCIQTKSQEVPIEQGAPGALAPAPRFAMQFEQPPFGVASATVSIPAATASTGGYLSATNWTTFNNKATSSTYTGSNTITLVGALTSGSIGDGFTSVAFTRLVATKGLTVIPAGSVAASVTHSLGTTPSAIFLSWNVAAPAAVSSSTAVLFSSVLGATYFTVNINTALSNAPTICWLAIP